MLPSKKALEAAFPGKGKELRELLEKKRKTRDYESVRKWEAQCFHTPSYQERLETAVNEILEGYGAEAIFGGNVHWPKLSYINFGDSYATTLMYDYDKGRWSIGSWGDWVERYEAKHGELTQ